MPGCIPRLERPSSFWTHPPRDREPRHIGIRSARSGRWAATSTACREVVVGTSCRSRRLGTGRLCIQVNVNEADQDNGPDFPTYPNRSRDWLRPPSEHPSAQRSSGNHNVDLTDVISRSNDRLLHIVSKFFRASRSTDCRVTSEAIVALRN
jgi:hypothetical protein